MHTSARRLTGQSDRASKKFHKRLPLPLVAKGKLTKQEQTRSVAKQASRSHVTSDPTDFTPAELEAMGRFTDEWLELLNRCKQLIANGDPLQAAMLLEQRNASWPNSESTIASLATAYARLGWWEDAFQLLAGAQDLTGGDPRSIPLLALAAAQTGRVFPGQIEYCGTELLRGVGVAESVIRRSLPTSSRPESAAFVASLLLAVRAGTDTDDGIFYSRLALRLAPRSPYATFMLAHYKYVAGKYAEAAALSAPLLTSLPEGAFRDVVVRDLYNLADAMARAGN